MSFAQLHEMFSGDSEMVEGFVRTTLINLLKQKYSDLEKLGELLTKDMKFAAFLEKAVIIPDGEKDIIEKMKANNKLLIKNCFTEKLIVQNLLQINMRAEGYKSIIANTIKLAGIYVPFLAELLEKDRELVGLDVMAENTYLTRSNLYKNAYEFYTNIDGIIEVLLSA